MSATLSPLYETYFDDNSGVAAPDDARPAIPTYVPRAEITFPAFAALSQSPPPRVAQEAEVSLEPPSPPQESGAGLSGLLGMFGGGGGGQQAGGGADESGDRFGYGSTPFISNKDSDSVFDSIGNIFEDGGDTSDWIDVGYNVARFFGGFAEGGLVQFAEGGAVPTMLPFYNVPPQQQQQQQPQQQPPPPPQQPPQPPAPQDTQKDGIELSSSQEPEAFADGGLVAFQEGGYISDEEYDRRLLSRMKRDTGRVTEPTPSEQREAFGQAAREAGQMAADVLLPQSPLDAALMVALGPGGRVARMAGAGALAALEPSEAEAGIVKRAADATRGLPSAEGFRPVYPQPQRAMPLGEQIPGGRYLENPARNPETGQMEGIDITGQTRQGTRIEIGPDGSPRMMVAPGATEKAGEASGNVVRTNLFRREAGWNWIGNPPPGISEDARFLISVQPKTNQHIYALATDFEGPATMARYPRAANEPRLRPTTRGDVELGNVVGRIDVRGREHPVYDHVYIFNREPKAPSPSRSRRRGTLGIQPTEEPMAFAEGGLVPLAGGGKVAVGPGGGLDDLIPTSINGRQAAALSDGEFVIPADVVSMMGDGSSNAGARRLYDLVRQVRDNKTGTTRQAGPLPVGDILKRSMS